ncbi:MAG: hypothetical protein R2713_18275 [Ilumatobacteraceae bacterium]
MWVGDADGALGTRVLELLAGDTDLRPASIEEASVVVWTAGADPDARARRRESLTAGAAVMFGRLTAASHVVIVSSAMVYGAWENNPVPLTEDAVLRPDTEFRYATQLAAVEQMADDWRLAGDGRTVTVLRPAVTMAAAGTSGLARALAAGLGQRFAIDDPPAQFLHLDDLASAVVLGVRRRLDGAYNVAPDGSVPAASVRALAGARPRVRLPDRVAEVSNSLRWRFQRGPIPPGLRSYTRAPWLVANDRLRAVGWRPTVTNEQAYVEGTEARWWTMITPKRRQELSLGATGAVLVGIAAGAMWVTRWARRRRARR